MKSTAWLLILAGVLLNAGAQLLLKQGANSIQGLGFQPQNLSLIALKISTQPSIWLGLLAYTISVVLWILALSRVDVSVAYPMVSLGYVVNAWIAWQWLGESLSLQRCVGIAVILLGVVLVAKSA